MKADEANAMNIYPLFSSLFPIFRIIRAYFSFDIFIQNISAADRLKSPVKDLLLEDVASPGTLLH